MESQTMVERPSIFINKSTIDSILGKCTVDPHHFWQNQVVTEIPGSTKVYSMYSGASILGRQIEGSRLGDLDPDLDLPMGTSHVSFAEYK